MDLEAVDRSPAFVFDPAGLAIVVGWHLNRV
jgi:hypothetical protein